MTGLGGRDWRQLAACARPGVDPDLFFPGPTERGKERQAKRICADCPVKAPCLADALARPPTSDFGIYGGTTPQQREQIRQRAEPDRRSRRSLLNDPALALAAFELARRIGTVRAARQLGVDSGRLFRAWDEWHLGRPNWHGRVPPAAPLFDPLEAQRAFQFAEQVGLQEAAERLGMEPSVLVDAWERWGLGRPGARATPARPGLPARPDNHAPARPHRVEQPTRAEVAAAARPRAARARSGPEERER